MNINVNTETLRNLSNGTGGLKQTAAGVDETGARVSALSGKMSEALRCSYTGMLEDQIRAIGNNMRKHAQEMEALGNAVETVANNYEETEKAITEMLQQ